LASKAERWSLTSLREKLIKIGAKVVSHGRYVRGRRVAADVRGYPDADCPAAGTARTSMTGRRGRKVLIKVGDVRLNVSSLTAPLIRFARSTKAPSPTTNGWGQYWR
jgi:hypothetical protein